MMLKALPRLTETECAVPLLYLQSHLQPNAELLLDQQCEFSKSCISDKNHHEPLISKDFLRTLMTH